MIFSHERFDKKMSNPAGIFDYNFGPLIVYKRMISCNVGYLLGTGGKKVNNKVKSVIIALRMRKMGNNYITRLNWLNLEENALHIRIIPYNQKTPEMIRKVIRLYPLMLEFIPEEMKTRDIIALAVQMYPVAIKFIPEHLLTSDIIKSVLLLRDCSVKLASDDEVIDKNLEHWNGGRVYISERWSYLK